MDVDRPLPALIAELTDMAAWIERTKPQGVLYDSVLPSMREAATTITRLHATITQMTNAIDGLEFQLNEARAEIEALKSDVSDLVRAGSDEATENERLVKERDEALADNAKLRMMMEAREKLGEAFGVDMHKNATEAALEFAQREIDAIARAETAESQRDAALEALRPFAKVGMRYLQPSRANMGDDWLAAAHSFNIGDFRAASRTLEGE